MTCQNWLVCMPETERKINKDVLRQKSVVPKAIISGHITAKQAIVFYMANDTTIK